jgi:hypothetical protein
MIAISLPVAILSALAILQVGVVLGMWLKSVLGGGYDFHVEGGGYQPLPGRDDATVKLPPRAP